MTSFGTKSFTYSSENMLLTTPNSTTLSYDPLLRLAQETSGVATNFAYDGIDRIAEYSSANTLQRRYVHGPGVDEPIVWYEGSGTVNRRFLSSDERGSILSVTDANGALLAINRYDEYGQPAATNLGVWGYTGQAWLGGPGLWYHKARVYEPELGRFLQTDPIGYEDSPNLYAYAGNDPVNLTDPLGLEALSPGNAAAAQMMFGPTFNPAKVSVKFGYSSLPRAAMTFGNTIFVRSSSISPGLLFHELTHTWQFQSGLDEWALFQAQLSDLLGFNPYDYEIRAGSSFSLYNTEAQAQIVEVCVRLKNVKAAECKLVGGGAGNDLRGSGLGSSSDNWRHFFALVGLQSAVVETRGFGVDIPIPEGN